MLLQQCVLLQQYPVTPLSTVKTFVDPNPTTLTLTNSESISINVLENTEVIPVKVIVVEAIPTELAKETLISENDSGVCIIPSSKSRHLVFWLVDFRVWIAVPTPVRLKGLEFLESVDNPAS